MSKNYDIVNFTEEEMEIIRLSQSLELLYKNLTLKLKLSKTAEGRARAEVLINKLNSITIQDYFELKETNRFLNKTERVL